MKFERGEVNIICSDQQKSLLFYRDVLGFTVTTDDEGFYHLQFDGNQYLLLPIAKHNESVLPYGSVPQFSMDLMVDDIEAAYDYFKAQKVKFAQEWTKGEPMFVIRDPDGLAWEVVKSNI